MCRYSTVNIVYVGELVKPGYYKANTQVIAPYICAVHNSGTVHL
jgi:hypothetical protein